MILSIAARTQTLNVLTALIATCRLPSLARNKHKIVDILKMNGNEAPIATFTDSEIAVPLQLIEKIPISPDTRIFRFRLPSANHVGGLKAGQHVIIREMINGEKVGRKFTHTSDDETLGIIDFLIKIYAPNVHPDYPTGGKLTSYIETRKIGDFVNFYGPVGRIQYMGDGQFNVREKKTGIIRQVSVRRLGMVAGGSGITPIWQVLTTILKRKDDATQLWLLFANRTPADVLLKEQLDKLAAEHPDRFRVWYTVNRPDEKWRYSSGYVNKEMLAAHMPPAGDDVGILLCGPKGFKKDACIPNLKDLGFNDNQIIIF